MKNQFSRRRFLELGAAAAGLAFIPMDLNAGDQKQKKESKPKKPNSKFGGVQVGAITYSWRSMPSTAEDILKYCLQTGISSIELMGDVAENYAGIPRSAARPGRGANISEADKAKMAQLAKEASQAQKKWRQSASMDKYVELRKMFNNAGVQIHIVKFAPGRWSDEEIEYSFKAAKALGAKGVCDEIGEEACKRMGPVAEKHGMLAIFHNHLQPGEPGWSFDKFLEYSPANVLNFDAGHYFGATGLHPNGIIEKFHDRMISVHMKDKTGPKGNPANTNMSWGTGETPIADILLLIKKNKWPIHADIELEYPVPEGSDAVAEVKKCVEFSRKILA